MIDGETEFEFTVNVKGWYEPQSESQVFTVIAKTEDEAMDMAEELSDFDEIDDCEILKVMEA